MTYDTYGNIISKNGQTYFYDSTWHDLLTGIESESIEYDAQGNPTKYLGHTLVWEKGRQLKSFDGNTYTYNANGIRTSKTVNGVTHTYTLDGTKILKETWGENTLIPLYDNEDSVCGIIYNDYAYYFLKNLQGDVIAITNNKGKVVASYTYDAWGVCTIVSDNTGIIARVNPFRYRSYYYDQGIGLYYLQSRYYDPQIGRFINGDEAIYNGFGSKTTSYNLTSYCRNDCINYIDISGCMAVSVLRMLSTIYNSGIINESTASLSAIALNGLGLYTAFHEIAQLNIAKKLRKLKFKNITLEYRIAGKGEADIVATKSKKYVWEVKPSGTSPDSQLKKYTTRTGLTRGYNIGNINDISICGRVKMNISFNSTGGAFYSFYVSGRRITNAQLQKALKAVIIAACSVAASIILATILEDILTWGIGIWNDAHSFAGATASMSPIIVGGLRLYGYA